MTLSKYFSILTEADDKDVTGIVATPPLSNPETGE